MSSCEHYSAFFFCADENSTYNTDIYTMVDCDEWLFNLFF